MNNNSEFEKNKDMAKKHYFPSNHQDAVRDVILTDGRIEEDKKGDTIKRTMNIGKMASGKSEESSPYLKLKMRVRVLKVLMKMIQWISHHNCHKLF